MRILLAAANCLVSKTATGRRCRIAVAMILPMPDKLDRVKRKDESCDGWSYSMTSDLVLVPDGPRHWRCVGCSLSPGTTALVTGPGN